VVERLNSPELLWYWIDNNLTYKREDVKTPYQVFKTKKAQCVSSSYFGEHVLNRAGYETFIRFVVWGKVGVEDHAGAGIIREDGRYFLVVDFYHPSSKPLSGPYDTIEEVDEVLACRHRIIDRMWGTPSKPGN
jgi:hypothetical protein